ncbi:hypothetical protein HDF26_003162 [Pedobacter cryoconitis]|uniref:PQQ-like beta-propeller repeat protein n=1 Tax=Pedobacter cryoconitis TaxID=188932 RepID=UPI0016182906|nr:PQQ-like beta-propeller repeat protein [Pedobacter cryoconitis]MBB6272705.1 hypothetical protein [Pedobacter cryoconitis]
MKNYYFLLLIPFFFLTNAKAAYLTKFAIQSQYLSNSNSLNVNTNGTTPFAVNITIARDMKIYGYENIDWILTVVFQKSGEPDLVLSTPKVINGSDFSGGFMDFTTNATLPAGKSGGKIILKYSYIFYNTTGVPISNVRSIGESNSSYNASITPTPPPSSGFNLQNARLFMANPSGYNMRKADYVTGGQRNFAEQVWANIQGMTSLNDYLYVVQADNLHKVDKDGNFILLGELGIWKGTEGIASSTNGYLYIVQNSRIHKVNPTTGEFSIIGNPEWANTDAIVAYNGYLFLAENGYLYKVNENTGTYIQLNDADWKGTEGMASGADGWIYIVQNGYLHKVDAETGTIQLLGGRDWPNTNNKGVAFFDNSIYILQNYSLHRVNKNTGTFTALGNREYSNSCHLTVL